MGNILKIKLSSGEVVKISETKLKILQVIDCLTKKEGSERNGIRRKNFNIL